MLRGLYSAAAGMITQQRKHDTATNNISNLSTPGFKQGVSVSRSFPEMMITMMNDGEGGKKKLGPIHTGVMVEETLFPIVQSELLETMKPTDFALVSNIQVFENVAGEEVPIAFDGSGKYVNDEGEVIFQPQAFFTAMNENDELRYTRNGQFYIDDAGGLRTTNGMRVLDTNEEPIVLAVDIEELRVNERGQLFNALTNEALVDADGAPVSLLVSQVDNPNDLIREGNSVFRLDTPDDNPSRPVDNINEINVQQGYIESSNVDPIASQTNMLQALRAYESNQRVVQFYDQTLDKAVNEIGRV